VVRGREVRREEGGHAMRKDSEKGLSVGSVVAVELSENKKDKSWGTYIFIIGV
jgi:hypothetical protein